MSFPRKAIEKLVNAALDAVSPVTHSLGIVGDMVIARRKRLAAKRRARQLKPRLRSERRPSRHGARRGAR